MSQEPGWTEVLGEHASNPTVPCKSGHQITIYERIVDDETGEVALGRVLEEWTMPAAENRVKAQFEQWVRHNGQRCIEEAEAAGQGAEASERRSVYMSDFAAGHYNWDGLHCRKARGDIPGICRLLYLLLRRSHPEVAESDAERLWHANPKGCGEALAWSLGNLRAPAPSKNGVGETTRARKTEPVTIDP